MEHSGRVRPVNGSSSGSRAKRGVNLSRRAAAQSAQQAKQTEALARRQTQRTAKGVKEAAQAAKRGAQAAIAAAKSAMTALAAGGGATMFFLLPILVIGLLAGSIFAIFLPDEAERVSTRTVIQRIDREYNERLEEIKSDYSYDRLELSGGRPSWREVLAFYAVLVNTDPDNPRDVAVMDEDRADILRKVFWEMIEIEADTGTVTEINYVETVDGDGNPVTEAVETELTVLYITVRKTPMEVLYLEYAFDEERCAKRDELLSDEYVTLWNNVLYGTGSGCADLVAVALSQVGNSGETYWSYMGYTSRVEWCACFVSWCANECGYIEDGTLPKTAGCVSGESWFRARHQWQDSSYTPNPGDIIYFDWDKVETNGQDGITDHVGIVEKVEGGYIYTIEGNSGDRVSNNAWAVGHYEIYGFGVPVY